MKLLPPPLECRVIGVCCHTHVFTQVLNSGAAEPLEPLIKIWNPRLNPSQLPNQYLGWNQEANFEALREKDSTYFLSDKVEEFLGPLGPFLLSFQFLPACVFYAVTDCSQRLVSLTEK